MDLLFEKSNDCTIDFANFILHEIKKTVLARLSPNALQKCDNYFINSGLVEPDRKGITKEIILKALNNLVAYDFGDYFILKIDTKIKLDAKSDLNIDSAIKLITYGNLEFKGYPIILDVFNEICNKLNKYYLFYKVVLQHRGENK